MVSGIWRWRLVLVLALLVAEGLFLGLSAGFVYSVRGLNIGGTRTGDYLSEDKRTAAILALWAGAHLLVAGAAALSRTAAWRVTAGAVQLIDVSVLVNASLNGPKNRAAGETVILMALALVLLAGAAVVLVPLRSPPTGPR